MHDMVPEQLEEFVKKVVEKHPTTIKEISGEEVKIKLGEMSADDLLEYIKFADELIEQKKNVENIVAEIHEEYGKDFGKEEKELYEKLKKEREEQGIVDEDIDDEDDDEKMQSEEVRQFLKDTADGGVYYDFSN